MSRGFHAMLILQNVRIQEDEQRVFGDGSFGIPLQPVPRHAGNTFSVMSAIPPTIPSMCRCAAN